MSRPKCIICGKINGTTKHKFPHGTLCVCFSCQNELTNRINNSAPVVWMGREDFLEHEILSKDVAEILNDPEILRRASQVFADYLWDSMGDTYSDTLKEVGIRLEKQYVLNTPEKDLPLILMESLNSFAAKACLESRLKGCEPDKTYEL